MVTTLNNTAIKKSSYVVSAIKSEWIDEFWPYVQEGIQRAIDHSNNELDIDVIYDRLKHDDMFLLVVSDGTGVVYASTVIEVRVFETGKRVLNVTTTGGYEMEKWLPQLIEGLRGVAGDLDCEELYVVGRLGWTKVLKKQGFKVAHQIMSMGI